MSTYIHELLLKVTSSVNFDQDGGVDMRRRVDVSYDLQAALQSLQVLVVDHQFAVHVIDILLHVHNPSVSQVHSISSKFLIQNFLNKLNPSTIGKYMQIPLKNNPSETDKKFYQKLKSLNALSQNHNPYTFPKQHAKNQAR